MADSKKSIIVYADWIEKFEELSDDEAGKLIKHFFRYVNDLNPTAPDRLTKMLFIDIQNSLKRDLDKWENIKERRSEAGKASAAAKKLAKEKQQKTTKSTSVNKPQQTPTKSTVSVSVSDSVSVSVTNKVVEEVITGEDDFENKKNEEIAIAADYLEETKNIPADFILNEEEFSDAEKYLKSQSFFNIIQMQQDLSEAITLKYFRIFYEQKAAFDELKNHKKQIDLLKNFFYWIPKYKKSLIDNKPKDATTKPNGGTVTGQFTRKNSTADQNRAERGQLGEIARNVVFNAGAQ